MPSTDYVYALYSSDDMEHVGEPEDIVVIHGASKVLARELFINNGWPIDECEYDNIGLLQVVNSSTRNEE